MVSVPPAPFEQNNMNKNELTEYISEIYNTDPDHPWASDPDYAVFRHSGNRKWFALIMDIPGARLGLECDAVSIVNLKNDPVMSGSLRSEPGIFPAYHMNKESWISVALDGTVPDEKLKMLLDISFGLTKPKPRKRK